MGRKQEEKKETAYQISAHLDRKDRENNFMFQIDKIDYLEGTKKKMKKSKLKR